ncbi:uncharacterized protein ACBR49_004029 isoform 2-T2 [Aulostomus maculatus]
MTMVLLYWPNIIGIDGWLARRLSQASRFGAWLDVVVDNLGRGMLWSQLCQWGWLVSALEWCVFVCNHNTGGEHWKDTFINSPRFIQAIMANGFRTFLGTWVVSGLHFLPLWIYGYHHHLLSGWLCLPPWFQTLGTLMLSAGRVVALSVEVWCVCIHIQYLTRDEEGEKDD